MKRRIFFAAVGCAMLAAAPGAAAQPGGSFPDKPVRVVVPYAPGGGIDILIRAVGKELQAKWGQPVVVDNRAGASGLLGAETVTHAAPDGYTLLASVDPTFTSNRYLYKSLPYDPDRSFEPITMMVRGDNLLLAHPSVPAKDLRELVALARSQPKALSFASYGNGTHPQLVYEYLNKREGIDLLHVPYKGIAPAMLATVAKEVNLSVGSGGVSGEMLRAGRLKALAVAGRNRLPQFPDVPTTAEQGFPYLLSFIWYGLFAPAGTPRAVVEKIQADVAAVLRDKAFAEAQVLSKGLAVVASTPAELSAAIREDSARNAEMIRAAGVQPE